MLLQFQNDVSIICLCRLVPGEACRKAQACGEEGSRGQWGPESLRYCSGYYIAITSVKRNEKRAEKRAKAKAKAKVAA